MQRTRRIILLGLYNIYTFRIDYIQVFALIRLFQFLFVVPVTSIVFKLMLQITGYTHITEQNIQIFLAHPFVICVMLLWVMVVLLFIYYEMGFLFLMAYNQQRGIRYKYFGIWQQLNRKVVYFFSFQTIFLVVYIVVLLPLATFMLPLSLTQTISIPHFFKSEMMHTWSGRLLYASVVGLLVILGIRSILTLPIFTIHPKLTIRQSFLQSWRFSKRGLIELLVLLAMLLIGHLLILLGITVLGTLPLIVVERIVPSKALVTAGMTLAFLEISFVILISLLQAMFSQVMVAITYNTLRLTKKKIAPIFLKKRYKRVSVFVTIIFIVLSVINIDSLEKSFYAPDTKIIAHRGNTVEGVENTISGLVHAAKMGADLVELDVQQTADGEFVVFHDRTLRRLAGKNGVVSEMTLNDLKTITIHANGFSDKIPSLDEFIEKAQVLDIPLLIELKVHGKETVDVLPRLIEKLRAHQVLDTYYVQSLDPHMMVQLKKMMPTLRVGIVYALNIGSISDTTVDFIALEESSVSTFLIEELRQRDIDLFVWTLNKESTLQEFIGENVSGVITDHPDTALQIRTKQSEHLYFLHRILNWLEFIF